MHNARDLPICYEVDLIKRSILINVEWIDTDLIKHFLRFSAVEAINRELEIAGKLPLISNVNGFVIKLVVAEKAQFKLKIVERDFEPRELTLVMKIKD